MEPDKMAVLVLDMNRDHIENNNPYNSERLRRKIPAIKLFLDRARKIGTLIVHVTDAHRPRDWVFSIKSFRPHAISGTRGAEIIDELKPKPGDYVVKKRRFSGFYGTDLDLYLRELEIKNLLLVGGPTHVSVRYTAADAYYRRYKVFVIKDCTDSPTRELFEFALEDMFFTTRISLESFFTKYLEEGSVLQ